MLHFIVLSLILNEQQNHKRQLEQVVCLPKIRTTANLSHYDETKKKRALLESRLFVALENYNAFSSLFQHLIL